MAFKLSNLFNSLKPRSASTLGAGEGTTPDSASSHHDSTATANTEASSPEATTTQPQPEGSLTGDNTAGSTPGTRGTDVINPIISD